jgi:hypothetical protein
MLARRRPVAHEAKQPEWQSGDQRRSAAQIVAILTIERLGVAAGFVRARIPLDAARAATALARPAHGGGLAREAQAMPEDAAAQHGQPVAPAARSSGGPNVVRDNRRARPSSTVSRRAVLNRPGPQ